MSQVPELEGLEVGFKYNDPHKLDQLCEEDLGHK